MSQKTFNPKAEAPIPKKMEHQKDNTSETKSQTPEFVASDKMANTQQQEKEDFWDKLLTSTNYDVDYAVNFSGKKVGDPKEIIEAAKKSADETNVKIKKEQDPKGKITIKGKIGK